MPEPTASTHLLVFATHSRDGVAGHIQQAVTLPRRREHLTWEEVKRLQIKAVADDPHRRIVSAMLVNVIRLQS